MSNSDWLGSFLRNRDDRRRQAENQRQHELWNYQLTADLAPMMWQEISRRLTECIEQYNCDDRVEPEYRLTFSRFEGPHSVLIRGKKSDHLMLAIELKDTGVLSFRNPAYQGEMRILAIKVAADKKWHTIDRVDEYERHIPIDQIDQVLLADFIESYDRI
jgi:hypothetical protein